MFKSDNSSFCQQETGIAEMKSTYEILKDIEGVYGARPSGAGFTTRLYPLTKDKAKLLLEVEKRV